MSHLTQQSLTRRRFLRGQFLRTLQNKQEQSQGHTVIRPPWAKLTSFLEACTACGNCIKACETQIIVRGAGGYPEINFNLGECTFCTRCVASCEADVFDELTSLAWTHKIEIQATCLAHHRIECRRCEDSCQHRAIQFKRQLGNTAQPVVNGDKCNGCGACIPHCPKQAINIIHLQNIKR